MQNLAKSQYKFFIVQNIAYFLPNLIYWAKVRLYAYQVCIWYGIGSMYLNGNLINRMR